MDKKIFFLDLDGTLLKDDKTIPEENIAAIREALGRGHLVAIATGRPTTSSAPVARNLGMTENGCFLISYNGAAIHDLRDMTPLRRLRFSDACAAYLFSEAERCHIHAQSYFEDKILTRRDAPELRFYMDQSKMESRVIPGLFDKEVFPTSKVLLASLDDHEALKKFQRDHLAWERGRCISFFSASEYLEYCHVEGTKGGGVAFLENHLDIAHENTVAVGDEDNDLSMILFAGTGVAMKNADARIRTQADYITKNDNNAAGVAEAIRKFI